MKVNTDKSFAFLRLWLIVPLLFIVHHQAIAQIVINEGSNRNYPTLTDEDGDYEDWIEIHNAGNTPVDLYNYSLSDNASPGEWVFPHRVLNPGGFLVVFCSGKNRFETTPFTKVVSDSAFQPGSGWNAHQFETPFLWDGQSNLVIDVCSYNDFYTENSIHLQSATSYNSSISAFIDGSSASALSIGSTAKMRPNMRLNNAVIGSGNSTNGAYDYPAPYGNWYWSARHQFLVPAGELTAAGLVAGSIDSLSFSVSTPNSVNYSWIDLSISQTQLSSLENSFLKLSGNYNHTNFKISRDGEVITLFNPSGSPINALNVQCGPAIGVSVGCLPDAAVTTPKLFGLPTPGTSNNLSIPSDGMAMEPVFSRGSGIYQTPISVSIADLNSPNARIFYTTDGSDPDTNSLLWGGTPIFIFQSGALKARAFADGRLPSIIKTASYLLNVSHVTPIISVVTDNENLFGPTGMFDNPTLDLLKPASVDYFDSTSQHKLQFSGRTGIMMDGGWGGSRYNPQKSFRIKFDHSVLGEGPITGPIIPGRPNRTTYSDFYLRNGSNQYLRLPYKDAAQVKIAGEGNNNYYSAWRPVTVYLNGAYWGLYELREKLNIEMFELLDGADPDSVEILGSTSQYGFVLRAIEGSTQSFYDSYDSLLQIDPSDTTFWAEADRHFDMKYYTDYIIAESWMDNGDWAFGYNNLKLYRSDATDFRWRYCLMDLEMGLLPSDDPNSNCSRNFLASLTAADTNNPHLNIWLRGMRNDRFRHYFINRFADQMNTQFLPSRLLAVENSMFNQTILEMPKHYQRWGDANNVPVQLSELYQTHLLFQSELSCRSEQVRNHIQSEFQLPQQVDLTLDVYPLFSGSITVSTVTPEAYPWTGTYFDGIPIKIEARAKNDYTFSHWESNDLIADTLNPVFIDTLKTNATVFRAHYNSTSSNPEVFAIYPNPSSAGITIKPILPIGSLETLTFIDLLGRVFFVPFEVVGFNEYTLDVSALSKGHYIIRYLSQTGTSFHSKFIKL